MINIRMQQPEVKKMSPKITVVGVGGAGGNAVNNMIASGLEGVDFVVCNTDSQALSNSRATKKLQLGTQVTGGLGAGAKPQVGQAAAEESIDDVIAFLDGANMAFITAGMGGGTGTGAAPVIARAARERGLLTVGVVTKPFHFEGTMRMKMAEEGIAELQQYVDTLIVIPNQNLFRVANEKTTFAEAFRMADSVLQSGVRGVTDLMVMPGLINLDFADIRSAMTEMGKAMMGTGEATGDKRAMQAAESAINNPLLDDVSMKGARGVIINVTGGYDMTLFEVDEACNRIRDEVDQNANIIFGSTFDEGLEGLMRVTVLATGIDGQTEKKSKPVSTSGWAPAESRAREIQAPVAKPATPRTYSTFAQSYAPAAPARVPSFTPEVQVAQPVAEKPKAARFQDTFIPPKPVEVPVEEIGATSHLFEMNLPLTQPVQQQPQRVVQAPQIFTAAAQQNHIQNSPASFAEVQPAQQRTQHVYDAPQTQNYAQSHATARKVKSPSLFERLTGGFLHREDDGVDSFQASQKDQPLVSERPQQVQPPVRPQQDKLNLDQPSKPASGESELDIPAFLRRQAS